MSKKQNGNRNAAGKAQSDYAKSKADQKSASHFSRGGKKGKKQQWRPGQPVSLPVKIVLILFIILMALSMMLPSLSLIFSSSSSSQDQQQEQSSDSSTSSDSSSDSSDDNSVDAIDARYQALVDEQQKKLDSDSSNLAALLNMGEDYMKWGAALQSASSSTTSSSSSDSSSSDSSSTDDTAHATDIFNQAIATFDKYLALNDSSAVKLEKAMCQYYAGDTDSAIATLEALTQSDSNYGPAWARLGILYQAKGDTDSAKNAYNKAIAVEPDDEYGSKTLAEQQLASIGSRESAPTSSSSDTSSSSSSTASDLASTLSSETDTGL